MKIESQALMGRSLMVGPARFSMAWLDGRTAGRFTIIQGLAIPMGTHQESKPKTARHDALSYHGSIAKSILCIN